jgi:hypothetical protein
MLVLRLQLKKQLKKPIVQIRGMKEILAFLQIGKIYGILREPKKKGHVVFMASSSGY